MAELLNHGTPIMPGKSEVDQFTQICKLIGYPRKWEEFNKHKSARNLLELVSSYKYSEIDEKFGQ